MAGMTAAAPTRGHLSVTLDFDPQAEPIAGSLHDSAGLPRPFVGWLGLLSALNAALTGGRSAGAEER